MNPRLLFTLKGALVASIALALLGVLFYSISLVTPEIFPRTFAVRLLLVMPTLGALVSGLWAWQYYYRSKGEKSQVILQSVIVLGSFVFANLVYLRFFGTPRNDDAKFGRLMLTQFTVFVCWFIMLGLSKRR